MDKELLQTLSNLFDDKLKPIHNDIKDMQGDIKGIHGEIKDMQGDIKGIHGEIKDMQGDIKGIHGNIKDMQGDIKGINGNIKDMQGDIKDLKNNQTRFEIKLDSVVDQTANLTEFRSLTLIRLDDIADNLNKVESITASNWKDITKLKSVK